MDRNIRSIWSGDVGRVAGPAYTVQCTPGDSLMLHAAIYRAPPGAVIVADSAGGERALAGGNVCAIAQRRGIAAFVIDGVIRDVGEIRALAFPVFARGIVPAAAGKDGIGALNGAIQCGGARVAALDLIVADEDGIVVIPRASRGATLTAAEAKAEADAKTTLDAWEQMHRSRTQDTLNRKGFTG
jgi:regulator of RNase E activity RraA